MSIRGNQKPFIFLNGSYHTRGRYFIVRGSAQSGDHSARFSRVFKGNHFITRTSIRDRVVTIVGRCSFDEEHQVFIGFWIGRGVPFRGWIIGMFTPAN